MQLSCAQRSKFNQRKLVDLIAFCSSLQLKARFPKYSPVSVLDFGSGPGTAIWAVRELWPQATDRIVAIEPSDGMTVINQKLLYGTII